MSDVILTPGPLLGSRKLSSGAFEEGAILAFRKDGEEVLYTPQTTNPIGLAWIPVGEFCVTELDFPGDEEHPDEEEPGEGEPTPTPGPGPEPSEVPSSSGPFPEKKPDDGVRRRPTTVE